MPMVRALLGQRHSIYQYRVTVFLQRRNILYINHHKIKRSGAWGGPVRRSERSWTVRGARQQSRAQPEERAEEPSGSERPAAVAEDDSTPVASTSNRSDSAEVRWQLPSGLSTVRQRLLTTSLAAAGTGLGGL